MEILIIINTLSIWALMIFTLVLPVNRLSFNVRRTFFKEVPFGFEVLLWEKPTGVLPNSGETIFNFDWRDEEKILDEPNI